MRTEIEILVTGMGAKNAEQRFREGLARWQPGLVLTCGFAGGLNPDLRPNAVVFAADDEFPLTPRLLSAGAVPISFHCSPRIVPTAAEKATLRQRTGTDAVEMESAAIRRVCRERQIPSATVRVISDTATEDLPLDFNQFTKPDLRLDYGKLAFAVLRSPKKLGALLNLQGRTRQAAEQLAGVLTAALVGDV